MKTDLFVQCDFVVYEVDSKNSVGRVEIVLLFIVFRLVTNTTKTATVKISMVFVARLRTQPANLCRGRCDANISLVLFGAVTSQIIFRV